MASSKKIDKISIDRAFLFGRLFAAFEAADDIVEESRRVSASNRMDDLIGSPSSVVDQWAERVLPGLDSCPKLKDEIDKILSLFKRGEYNDTALRPDEVSVLYYAQAQETAWINENI